MRSVPSPGECYLARTADFFIFFSFHFYFYFIFLLYLLSFYFSGDYGILPRVMIEEIRESYGDDEKIDRRPHSFVWEGEGRGYGNEYGVAEMLSFVCFCLIHCFAEETQAA
jgi:hypothetical protein